MPGGVKSKKVRIVHGNAAGCAAMSDDGRIVAGNERSGINPRIQCELGRPQGGAISHCNVAITAQVESLAGLSCREGHAAD